MGINIKEEFDLSYLDFGHVIDGLNKYFAEDETRVRVPRSYVEIKSPYNRILFYRFDAEMYLDKLIAWLRTEHGIFYYPGMEAKYAKTERIPPLTERLMDEGALNSLKKLYKRVTGEEPEVDSHTLIADGISHAVSVKEVQIEASLNGFELPEKVDGAPLSIERVFRDLIELLKKRDTEIKNLNVEIKAKESGIEDLKEHITLLESDLKKAKMEKERSDINKLISDYCNKFDIIAPSPDSSDNACVEYLFSVVDLERKHRAAVGKQMVDDYEKDIMDHIRQEASQNGYNLPEKVDGEPLTIERVFHDLLELMRKRGEELRILNSKCDRLDEIVEELNTLNSEIKEDLP